MTIKNIRVDGDCPEDGCVHETFVIFDTEWISIGVLSFDEIVEICNDSKIPFPLHIEYMVDKWKSPSPRVDRFESIRPLLNTISQEHINEQLDFLHKWLLDNDGRELNGSEIIEILKTFKPLEDAKLQALEWMSERARNIDGCIMDLITQFPESESNRTRAIGLLYSFKKNNNKRKKKDGEIVCVVCLERPPNVVLIDCWHAAFCENCFPKYNVPTCPICIKEIIGHQKIYFC